MSRSAVPEDLWAVVARTATPLFAGGATKVYVAWNSARVYVGLTPASKFVDSAATPQNVVLLPEDMK